jgi:hypothetical protein
MESSAASGKRTGRLASPLVESEVSGYFSTKMLCFSQATPTRTSPADYLIQSFGDEAEFLR